VIDEEAVQAARENDHLHAIGLLGEFVEDVSQLEQPGRVDEVVGRLALGQQRH
jgi:hypothetical protein